MPLDLPDVVYDTQYNINTATEMRSGHNLRRLKRYPAFYRRLRSRQRIGNLIYRAIAVIVLDYGGLLGLATLLWGAIEHRFKRLRSQAPTTN